MWREGGGRHHIWLVLPIPCCQGPPWSAPALGLSTLSELERTRAIYRLPGDGPESTGRAAVNLFLSSESLFLLLSLLFNLFSSHL